VGRALLLLLAMSMMGCVTTPSVIDALAVPLTAEAGDAARGKAIIIDRDGGHCILCHAVPEAEVKFAGNIAPPFTGVGSRLSAAQLRRRVVDITAIKPDAVMPAFHRIDNLNRVATAYRGKPILDAQQVEDVVAYLAALRN
jgi:sulfur-oxidizing protein SoxX